MTTARGERPGRAAAADGARTAAASSWQPIFDGVLDAVVRHRLAPGARLAEEELAEIYGVSRTVVRAALQALAGDGVVLIERNKGARLARPTPDEAREIFEARALIEPRIAVLAARGVGPGDVERLRASIRAEHRALHADDLQDAVFHSADFHRRIAAIAGQTVLGKMLGELLSRSSLVISLYWRRPAGPCSNEAHLALVRALSDRDEAAAARLMREHVEALLAGLDFSARNIVPSDLAAALRDGAAAPD